MTFLHSTGKKHLMSTAYEVVFKIHQVVEKYMACFMCKIAAKHVILASKNYCKHTVLEKKETLKLIASK